jgi:ribosomal protein S17E
MKEHPGRFSADYENNKKVIEEISFFRSKQLKNKVVGYITHYYKLQSRVEPVEGEEGQSPAPAEPAGAESGSSS